MYLAARLCLRGTRTAALDPRPSGSHKNQRLVSTPTLYLLVDLIIPSFIALYASIAPGHPVKHASPAHLSPSLRAMRPTIPPLQLSLLPRVFARQRHNIHRGTFGEPLGVHDGPSPSRRDAFRLSYHLDDTDKAGRTWSKKQLYPVGAVDPRQVVVLRSLSRHLTPEDFMRTVPRNIRGYIRGTWLRTIRRGR
jgi:hypothetical protein